MHRLADRVAVVTGAARGLGLAVAEALAAAGCRLALVDLDGAELERAATHLALRSSAASAHVCDVADADAMAALADEIATRHGRVHLVVNNAGVSVVGRVNDLALDDIRWIVGVNFWGTIHGCKVFLPQLLEADEAHIVNVASGFGLWGFPTKSAYCATKFAVRGFSEALAAELHGTSVGLTLVYPPAVATTIAQRGRAVDRRKQACEDEFLLGHGAQPERVAARIVKAIRRNRRRVLIGGQTRVLDLATRLAPILTARLLARFQHRVPFV